MSVLREVTDRLQGKTITGEKRSPQWTKVRNIHLRNNPKCVVCGSRVKVEVHHINPFHLFPEQELDPNNLISLCETATHGVICHLLVGHLGNYRSFNDNVVSDATTWQKKLENRP
jgi:5-methylcytosine-specific restriction protein A